MFAMWWVMMIAMMVPSAAPTILLFATIKRRQATTDSPVIASWLFLAGYLLIWAGFSLVAVSAQWGLERAGLLSGMMASTSNLLAGSHPARSRALPTDADQTRLSSLLPEPGIIPLNRYWQPDAMGALRMGFRHGSYCVGCCWFLMALLFVSRCHESRLGRCRRDICRLREAVAA